jgi:hypothetical protein
LISKDALYDMCGKASIDTHANRRKETPQHEPCDSSPSFPPIPDISNACSDKEVSCVYNKKAKWESEKPEYKVDVDGINDDDDDDSRDAQQRNETSKQGPSL